MYTKDEQKSLFNLSKKLLVTTGIPVQFEAADQIADLHKVLVYHEWKYYIQNDPVISDFEYDTLYKRLESLEAAYPDFITADSPTQRVSNDITESLPSVAHLIPMLSLANSYNQEDLNDFDTQIKKLTLLDENSDIEYCVEPKFDGGSIALVYENDLLIRGATRGNGTLGEEITNNARVMKSIPLRAAFSSKGIDKVEIRGEVVIRKDVFDKMNKEREMEGLSLFANPRNTASGGLRMKDPREVVGRGLEAFIYQLGYVADEEGNDKMNVFKSHDETIEFLRELGFKVPAKEKKVCRNIREVHEFIIEWQGKRDNYPYEIDGMVIKVNELALQEKCGYTSRHPRWAIAFKFKAKQATSRLLSVEYQIGKIGSITPVAKLEPVQLAGVTVSSVSLHNEDFISGKDIRIGDTVLVERAGDVIPYIVKPMVELRDGSEQVIVFPTNCPVCNTVLERAESEAAWRCPNYNCEAQVRQRMIFHVSKDAMDIDGFGKSYIERFYEMGWLHSLADIYRLDYSKIAALEGFGEKSATNLEKSINKAKSNPINRLLHSLSIHHVGKKVSKLIAAEVNHVLELRDKTVEDFIDIKDVGPVVAENIVAYFSNPENINLLKEMESLGVNLTQTEDDRPKIVDVNAPLAGKTILFTGTLLQMGRKEAQSLAEANGAKNISAVSSNLNILVAGEKAGSKLKKAEALGTVQILSEEAFLALVR
jgi:DNA ligase (NAD+)